ncbi:glycosyltransferase family 2 protein [Pedobacter nyackensis]|uniref:glycosyltransferase family 2 protein n=1 Tax=Pedobacter nyackensis TaxID=475255 RepID=UPI0029314723|nr:glycosyltransferase [Pedobacter nyackensis]
MEKIEHEVMLSICCVTYNHEKYIAQAIEGFLMQKTTFKYEILIGEDCSTDGTRKIVDEYAAKYPDRIKLITSETNVGAHQNVVRVIKEVKGKYIALCDGDDYWTNPLKLQKQVDFLDQNQDYIMCCHYSKRIKENNEIYYMNLNPKPIVYSFEDILFDNDFETVLLSVVFRNTAEINEMYKADWFYKSNAPDRFLKLYATFTSGKNIYVLPEVMSCYRKHSGGIWSTIHPKIIKQRTLSDLYLIVKIFKYSRIQRIKLLLYYLKNYFLFEVKDHSIQNAFSTIKMIL